MQITRADAEPIPKGKGEAMDKVSIQVVLQIVQIAVEIVEMYIVHCKRKKQLP
jgi:hypothetical protein